MGIKQKGIDLFLEGEGLIKQYNYKEALEKYLGAYELLSYEAASNKPEEVIYCQTSKLKIGQCYYWQVEHRLAIKHLSELVNITGNMDLRIKTLNMLSLSHLDLCEYTECAEYCQLMIETQRKDALYRAYSTLGLVRYYENQFDDALTHYQSALQFADETEFDRLYNNMALAYLGNRDYNKAIETIEFALKFSKIALRKGELLNTYSEILIEAKRFKDAEKQLNFAREIINSDMISLARNDAIFGRLYREMALYSLAEMKYSEALKFLDVHDILNEAANVCYELYCLLEKTEPQKATGYYARHKVYLDRMSRKKGGVMTK